jgi:Na+/alanine symporter
LLMPISVEVSDRVFDAARVDAFAQKIIDILNGGALSLMISVGHRTGLFDAMAGMAQATNAELAAKARLQGRCVREWLCAMTVGGIIEHDGDAGTHSHLRLTRAISGDLP